jgi:TolA-binding protein
VRRLARHLAPVLVLLGAAACASMPGRWKADESQQAWVDAFVEAQQLATEGRIAGADSALARFVTRFPDSPEAT